MKVTNIASIAIVVAFLSGCDSGYTPKESEGEIVITDSYGNVLTDEPEMQTPQEDSPDESN